MESVDAFDADFFADLIAQVVRFFGASPPDSKGSRSEFRRIEVALRRIARTVEPASYDRGRLDGVLAVVAAVRLRGEPVGRAVQTAPIEPGSLPERMLLEISKGLRGANADLAQRLGSDQWQVSRAGRRLRDLGLVQRTRAGRFNVWALTSAGELEVRRLRPR